MKELIFFLLTVIPRLTTHCQEYVSPTGPVQTGKSPGMKVKLISSGGSAKTYVLVFSPGDEVKSGLAEFARKYKVGSAHFSAVGDVVAAKVGFYDYQRKMFHVIPVDTSEVVSFTGNITLYNGDPLAHAHASFAVANGSVLGGHLLEMVVGPTLEVFVTVEPVALYKKLDRRYNSAVIDPTLEK